MSSASWVSLACLWITTYAFIWTILYNILRFCLFHKEQSTFSARLVASIHALTVTSLAYPMWKDHMRIMLSPGSSVTERQADVLAAILGYIIFDFIWCLTNNCEPWIMKVHHSICIFLIVMALTKANCGSELILIYAVNQVTNLFLQLRWFLRYHGFNNGGVELLFIISFFYERIWLSFTLFVKIARSTSVSLEFKLCLIIHCLIGYIFSYHVGLLVLNKVNRTFYGSTHKTPPRHSTLSFEQYESPDHEDGNKHEDISHEDKRVVRGDLSHGDSHLECHYAR